MLEPGNDVVHGLLDPHLGLIQILTADACLLKIGVAVQQFLGSGQVIVQEGIGLVLFGRLLPDHLEDLAGNGLQPVDLGGKHRIVNAVVGPADRLQHALIALFFLRCGRLRSSGCLLLCGGPLGGKIVIGCLLRAEQYVVAPVQIGSGAPHSLFDHQFQIPLRFALPHVGGLHQMGQRDHIPRSGACQILGKTAHSLFHNAAADQQRQAACQQSRGIEQLPQEVPPFVVFDGIAQPVSHCPQHGHAAQRRQHDTDDLHDFGAFVRKLGRLGDLFHGTLSGCLRFTGLLLLLLLPHLLRLGAQMLRRVGHHFLRPLGVIAELLDQQDQAHRPRHQKHNADQ